MSKDDAQDVVDGITERWDNAPEVVVVQDMQDPSIPEADRLTAAEEVLAEMVGFQPASVSQVQESNALHQRSKDFYNLKTQEVRAMWAIGIFEADQDKVDQARQMMVKWNHDNPDQKMAANMPAIVKRVREMRKDKAQRIADTAPKAMREQMRADVRELAGN